MAQGWAYWIRKATKESLLPQRDVDAYLLSVDVAKHVGTGLGPVQPVTVVCEVSRPEDRIWRGQPGPGLTPEQLANVAWEWARLALIEELRHGRLQDRYVTRLDRRLPAARKLDPNKPAALNARQDLA